MTGFVLRRIAWGALVVWLVPTLVFVMYFAVPRDVARLIAGRQASEETLAAVRARLGLDQPIIVQYGRFIGRWRRAISASRSRRGARPFDVARDIPVSASLALGGAALWLLMGVGAGVWRNPAAVQDRRSVTAIALLLFDADVPGRTVLLYILFFQMYRADPSSSRPVPTCRSPRARCSGRDPDPAVVHDRAGDRRRLRAADARGHARCARRRLHPHCALEGHQRSLDVVLHHALRSSLTPVVTQFGIDLGTLMGGAIVTEVVFGLPGLGREVVQAILKQDLPVIIGVTILSCAMVVAANLPRTSATPCSTRECARTDSRCCSHRAAAGRLANRYGAYQIGEVHARSWIVAGTPSSSGRPARAASNVLQRGVGISITRA